MGGAYSKEVTDAFFGVQGPDVRDCVICDPGKVDPLGADLLNVDPHAYDTAFCRDQDFCDHTLQGMQNKEQPFSTHEQILAVMCSTVPAELRERALDQIRSGGDRLPVRRRR